MNNQNHVKNPFLTRIYFESKICQSELFSIVADKDPVTEGHYMPFCNESKTSFADADFEAYALFLEKTFVDNIGEPYSYFERGRASFCTSLDGVIHAHGHLVPGKLDNVEKIFSNYAVNKHCSLLEAYKNIPTKEEYLLWGNLGDCFFTVCPLIDAPKRMIRSEIGKYYG